MAILSLQQTSENEWQFPSLAVDGYGGLLAALEKGDFDARLRLFQIGRAATKDDSDEEEQSSGEDDDYESEAGSLGCVLLSPNHKHP